MKFSSPRNQSGVVCSALGLRFSRFRFLFLGTYASFTSNPLPYSTQGIRYLFYQIQQMTIFSICKRYINIM